MVDEQRLARLDDLLERRSLNAVWFARPNSFAWLTGGSNIVDLGSPVGVAAAGYDGASVEVITANNERDRFRAEELPMDVTIDAFDWWTTSLPEAVATRTTTPAAADFDVPGLESIEGGSVRQPLTAMDISRSREIGTDAATAVESTCREVTPETTEREASAILHRQLVDRGFNVPCVLVGGADRAQKHRHFTPQPTPIGEYAIVTAGVERDGLFDSVTRIVAFDPPEWLDERHRVVSRVHATALAATQSAGRTGGTAADVFEAVRSAYDELGYPTKWQNHHQGGAAGFAMREWVATPDNDTPISLPMTFAWNPTLPGAKSEETILVTENDCELLTRTDSWPKSTYEAVGYDFEVRLNEIQCR